MPVHGIVVEQLCKSGVTHIQHNQPQHAAYTQQTADSLPLFFTRTGKHHAQCKYRQSGNRHVHIISDKCQPQQEQPRQQPEAFVCAQVRMNQRSDQQRQRQRAHIPVDHQRYIGKEAKHRQVASRNADGGCHTAAIERDHHSQPHKTKRRICRQDAHRTAREVASYIRILFQRVIQPEAAQEQEHIHAAIADLLHGTHHAAQAQLRMKKDHPQNGNPLDLIAICAQIVLHGSSSFAITLLKHIRREKANCHSLHIQV